MAYKSYPLRFYELAALCPLALPMLAVAAGIIAGRCGLGWISCCLSLAIAALSVAILLRFSSSVSPTGMRLRDWYCVPVAFFFCALGLASWQLLAPPTTIARDSAHAYCTARVADYKTITSGDVLQMDLLCFRGTDGSATAPDAPMKILVYTRSNPYRRGDVVTFRNHLVPLDESGNVSDSYVSAMFSRGVAWKQSLPLDRALCHGHNPALADRAADLRDRIVSFIERTPLQPDSRAFLEAVLLGDRARLDPATTESFAAAGVAHLLALSGMHLGIVTMLLSMALLPLALIAGRRSRSLVLLVGVWMFALLTGMSVSVVRAAVMTSVLLIAVMAGKRRTGFNALCGAGLLMLVVNPVALFNLGFQLSFITCGSLLLLTDLAGGTLRQTAERRYAIRHSRPAQGRPLLQKPLVAMDRARALIVGAGSVALATFAVSWMLSAAHFHRVTLMFLPANLVAGVLVWIIFMAAALYLPLVAAGATPILLGKTLDTLCAMLSHWCTMLSGADRAADYVYVDTAAMAAYLIAALMLLIWVEVRRERWLWMAVTAAAVALAATWCAPVRLLP